MKIQFERLPNLDTLEIVEVAGIEFAPVTAGNLVKKHPAIFKIANGRYGSVLTMQTNYGSPIVSLTYMDNTTPVVIHASDFATKTAGDRVWHPSERPR